MIMRSAALLATALLFAACPAHAEIEKSPRWGCLPLEQNAAGTVCQNAWPKLTMPEGWKQDTDYSSEWNANYLYFEGDDFTDPIYAGATPAAGHAATLDGFIAEERQGLIDFNPDYRVTEGPLFLTADGQQFRSLILTPKADEDSFDITAYGEEADSDGTRYYLNFTLSTYSQAEQDRYFPAFKAILEAYHR